MFTTTKALLCCTLLVFVFVDIEVVTAMPLEMAETQPQQIVVDDMVLDAVPAKNGNTDMYMLMPETSSDDAANDGESELTQNIIESQQQQQVADEAGTAEAASDMLMMESNDEPVQVEIVQAPGQSAMPLAEQIQMAEQVVQALNDDEKPEPAPLVQDEPEKAAETQQQQVASMEMPALEMLPMPEALIATENSSINEEAIDAPTQSLETQSVSDVIANAIDTIEQQIQAEQQLNDETANEDDLPQQQNDKISLQLFDLPTESEESAADDAKAESELEAAAAAAKPVEAEETAGNNLSELAAEAGESFMQALDNMLPEEVAEQQAIEEEKKQEEVEQQQQDDAEASEAQNVEQIVEAAKEEVAPGATETEQAPEAATETQAEQQSQPEPTQEQEPQQAPQQIELTEQIEKEEPKETVAEMEQEVAAAVNQEPAVEAEVTQEIVPESITANEEPQEQQQAAAATEAEVEVKPAEQSQEAAAESQVQEEIVPVEQAPMQAEEVEAQAAPEKQTESEMEIATPVEVQQVLEEIESEQENAQQNDEEPLILMPAEPEQMEQVQQVMQVISEAMAEAQNAETQKVEEQPQEPQQPAESEVAVEQVKVEMPEEAKEAEQQQANEETVAEAVEEPQEATVGVEFGVPEAAAVQSEVSMENLPAVAADEPVEEAQVEKVEANEQQQQVLKEEESVANEIESNAIAETAAEAAEAEVAAEQVQQDAEVAEESQAVAQTLVDAINLVESLETAQAVEDNKIEEQPTVEQEAPAAQETVATEQQQSEDATSEAEAPVESLMDDTQPAPEQVTAPQQQQPTELTSEQILTTIVQLPAALQQTEVETESQVPLAEAQQDDTNTQPQSVRDENLLASEPQQQITEQQQAATAAVAAAAVESSSTANVQQQQPLNVADSVLNYVNASFIQQQQQQTQQQQMQQQIQQQIQQAINNNLSNNNKKQQQQQPAQNNNQDDSDNKVTSHLRRYDGAQVWRIVVQNDRDKKLADELQSKYDGQLWKEVKQEVDYLLKPQVLAAAERHVRAANLSRIVLIDNLQRVIEVENPTPAEIAQLQNRKGHRLTWQAYHRLEDIHGFFDYLAKTYPDICSVETIGYSIEKRPLKILKVSNGNSSNPGIWMDGGMHAREWISPATVTYIANQIVEGWDDLPAYMRNINWYIHAVANPDGYEYSHTTDRLWRKNMRSHGRQCPGVDLNRNFGYKWGGKGTSANPCSQTYRGSKAFSEPETFYISKFISNFPRGTFQSYLSFHSYGQYVLFPWGYDYLQAADHNDLDRVARQAGSIITKSTGTKYTVGSSANTLYPAAGGSDDWAKGIAGIKYSYTIEMGDSGRYGFVLPASFIQTNGKDGYTFVDTVARSIVMKGNDKLRRRRS